MCQRTHFLENGLIFLCLVVTLKKSPKTFYVVWLAWKIINISCSFKWLYVEETSIHVNRPYIGKFFYFLGQFLKCEDNFQVWNLCKKLGGKVTCFRKKGHLEKKPMISQRLILWRRGGKEREVSIGRLLCEVDFFCNGLLSMWHFGKYFMLYWFCFLLVT